MGERPNEARVWCNTCGGEGHITDPKVAVIGGVAQTAIEIGPCRWCHGTGRRATPHPPV